jgi:RNA polymerase sigma-70 factor (ECF subfamily)
MAINLANSYLVRSKRWESPQDGFFDWIPCPIEYCPEWQAEMNDVQDRMLEAVSELNIDQCRAVVLYYLKSFSLREVARILDCPVGPVKSRLFYGRENMSRMLSSDRKVLLEASYV